MCACSRLQVVPPFLTDLPSPQPSSKLSYLATSSHNASKVTNVNASQRQPLLITFTSTASAQHCHVTSKREWFTWFPLFALRTTTGGLIRPSIDASAPPRSTPHLHHVLLYAWRTHNLLRNDQPTQRHVLPSLQHRVGPLQPSPLPSDVGIRTVERRRTSVRQWIQMGICMNVADVAFHPSPMSTSILKYIHLCL